MTCREAKTRLPLVRALRSRGSHRKGNRCSQSSGRVASELLIYAGSIRRAKEWRRRFMRQLGERIWL